VPGRRWAHGGAGRVAAFGMWWHRVPLGVWQVQALSVGCFGRWGMAVVVVLGAGHVTWQSLGRLDAGRALMMRLVLCRACDVAVAGPYWTSGVWPSLGRVRCWACGACSNQSK
jgi:hypothetical protein